MIRAHVAASGHNGMMELIGLTRIVDEVERVDHIDMPCLAWDFTDGLAAFQATYLDRMDQIDEDDENPTPYAQLLVAQILRNASEERLWSHIYKIRRGRNGLWTSGWLGDDYWTLRQVLGIGESGRGPQWSPSKFLSRLDAAAGALPHPGRHHIRYMSGIPYRLRGKVDEARKTILIGFRHHSGRRHQSSENYAKTRKWMGRRIADYCRSTNQSSCWTDHLDPGQRELPIPRNVMELQNSHQYNLPA
jgi:hypothetical protein